MSPQPKRPSFLLASLLLVLSIALGAHLSGIPIVFAKIFSATLLFMVYGYFAVRIVGSLCISSGRLRGALGFLLGALTIYLTWAIRLPAFSGWEEPFNADVGFVLAAIVDRAGSLELSRGLGAGTSTEGPSWLMLGTYTIEALAFLGVMVLGALAAGPEQPPVEFEGSQATDEELQSDAA